MKIFHICTIANNLEQYGEMKSSFLNAGFIEDKCRYSLFDNSKGNTFDPYRTFDYIKDETTEPFIIFCHQDVLLDQGDGFNKLMEIIDELNKLDPKWAVIGNAGFNDNHQQIVRIKDPNNLKQWSGKFPQKVHDLDENFLVINSRIPLETSSELSGFHFYASDLCLNAVLKGYTCYVVNFYLTHLSPGNFNQIFWNASKVFNEVWNRKFNFYFVKPTGVDMLLSKHPVMNYWFESKKYRKGLLLIAQIYNIITTSLKLRIGGK